MKIEKFNSFKINEGSPNYDFLDEVKKSNAYSNLKSKIQAAIDSFKDELGDEIGYEEGDNDDDTALNIAIEDTMYRDGY